MTYIVTQSIYNEMHAKIRSVQNDGIDNFRIHKISVLRCCYVCCSSSSIQSMLPLYVPFHLFFSSSSEFIYRTQNNIFLLLLIFFSFVWTMQTISIVCRILIFCWIFLVSRDSKLVFHRFVDCRFLLTERYSFHSSTSCGRRRRRPQEFNNLFPTAICNTPNIRKTRQSNRHFISMFRSFLSRHIYQVCGMCRTNWAGRSNDTKRIRHWFDLVTFKRKRNESERRKVATHKTVQYTHYFV